MVDETKSDQPRRPRRLARFTRRQLIAQIAVAAVILLSGMAIGGGGMILALRDRIMWTVLPPPPGPDVDGLIERWRADLDLTDEQAHQIKAVFSKRQATMAERLKKVFEIEQAERGEFVKSVKSVLTPQQFDKWQDELREREKHIRRWRPRGPGGRGEGPGEHRGPGPRGMRGPDGGPDRFGEPNERRGPSPRGMRRPEGSFDDMRGPNRPPEMGEPG